MKVVAAAVAVLAIALSLANAAQACVCVDAPVSDRLDDSDASVVGRVVRTRDAGTTRFVTVEVDQRVTGDVPGRFVARSPLGTDCDLPRLKGRQVGLLLTRTGDEYSVDFCSLVSAGELVVAGGEPRGGPIKVLIGLVLLGLVLLWSVRRLRTGKRPHLPGAPEP
jgi:MYXO-CTERM domain-containing protein